MLETLQKVQQLQVEVLKTGRDCHVDAGVYVSTLDSDTHIGFDVIIFEDNEIDKSFEFSYTDSEKELKAELAKFEAYVDRIKDE